MHNKEEKRKKKEPRVFSLKKIFFLLLASCFFSLSAKAQCAMCRASLESSGDKNKVEAVNDGIVFLMAIPYVLVAVIGFVVYSMYYKKR